MVSGFREVLEKWGLRMWGLSVLRTHVHAVVSRCEKGEEMLMNQLKGRASQALVKRDMHPFQEEYDPKGVRVSMWARRGWAVYLDTWADVRRAVGYVEGNPMKEGLGR